MPGPHRGAGPDRAGDGWPQPPGDRSHGEPDTPAALGAARDRVDSDPGHPPTPAHGHLHAHDGPAPPASARVRRLLVALLAPFAVATLVGLVVLWPSGAYRTTVRGLGFDQQLARGTVQAVENVSCTEAGPAGADGAAADGAAAPEGPDGPGEGGPGTGQDACARVTVRITEGPGAGRETRQVVSLAPGNPRFTVGDGVVLTYAPNVPEDLRYQIVDFERRTPTVLLGVVFAAAVVLFGRWRGLAALAALGLSFVALVAFILPAILEGANPLLVAIVGGSAIMLVALYLTHGFSARTSVAVLGTCMSLALIGLLGALFIAVTHLTGLGSDANSLLGALYQQVDLRGLLLAGMVIGSLGVLDDVTVTQTAVVWELKAANPSFGVRQLYRAAVRVGRDHIASTVNTLVLAYAGASLPLVLLFAVSQRGLLEVLTTEAVAQEVVRTLVGGIGLAASVPVTTGLAALVAAQEKPSSEAKDTGHAEPRQPFPRSRGRHRRTH
ncbi:hypothetical protein C3Y87_20150 [Carbonactinospora thermoautotrophica]|uniref:YibE/F family protein n=1 Tax=Carbonactinospora thermoautotrophica TaxID=1469144 RepID=UPI0022713FE7|nr:YibE/F family protein [Carbonactinospora thermoautotrophica]MCX9193653.1 hypothetical protein [Carbonactinospora thermoautotrophica]